MSAQGRRKGERSHLNVWSLKGRHCLRCWFEFRKLAGKGLMRSRQDARRLSFFFSPSPPTTSHMHTQLNP